MINLMMDDWVSYKGKPIKVEKICKDWFIEITDIELIPFTPEILEKNGFELNEEESESLSKAAKTKILAYDFPEMLGNRFLIEYDTKNKVAYLTDHCYLPIRYVHEFQQLLRLMSTRAEQVKQILDNFIV